MPIFKREWLGWYTTPSDYCVNYKIGEVYLFAVPLRKCLTPEEREHWLWLAGEHHECSPEGLQRVLDTYCGTGTTDFKTIKKRVDEHWKNVKSFISNNKGRAV